MNYTQYKSSLVLCIFLTLTAVLIYSCGKKSKKEKTPETGTVTDVNGNVYGTVKIGSQWWMSENLKVRSYNDSTAITEVKVTDLDSIWAGKNTGAFCSADGRFGLLYNWHALNGSKKIAPAGWHIPTDEEWKILEIELGMSQAETDKTSWRGEKESYKVITKSSQGWPAKSPVFGTNESGFSALPGGCRLFNGAFGEVLQTGYWWTATEKNTGAAWYRNISSYRTTIFRYYVDKNYGLAIRCVKD